MMSDDAEIRRLGESELIEWKTIRRAALVENPLSFGNTLANFERQDDASHLARPANGRVFGAFIAGRIVGSAAWNAQPYPTEAHRGLVTSVFVLPDHRGTEVARLLLERVVADAAGTVAQLELGVSTQEPRAVAFYEKMGFRIYGTLPRALAHGETYIDEHLMIRLLDA